MSGSRDKSLQDKLKVFFKKGASAPLRPRAELAVTAELARELSADTPLARRLRAVRDITERATVERVEEGGVEKIWSSTRDLLDEAGGAEARHAALHMLRALAAGQADHLQVMRTILFNYLRASLAAPAPAPAPAAGAGGGAGGSAGAGGGGGAAAGAEDAELRFELLHTLTNNGRNINCFEEEMGPFMLEWLPQIQEPQFLIKFLMLVINVVKFNATYLDEPVVHALVRHACWLCEFCGSSGEVHASLALLGAVVSYSLLPRAALPALVATLARALNVQPYAPASGQLMRHVVKADIGYAALQEMVEILRGGAEGAGAGAAPDAALLRGAVVFIDMTLFGPSPVPTLKPYYLAVLPAFLKALEPRLPVVTYEVLLATANCVSRAAHELSEPAWDCVLRILHAVLDQDQSADPPNEAIHTRLHALISHLEQLSDAGAFAGDEEALLAPCASSRSTSSSSSS